MPLGGAARKKGSNPVVVRHKRVALQSATLGIFQTPIGMIESAASALFLNNTSMPLSNATKTMLWLASHHFRSGEELETTLHWK